MLLRESSIKTKELEAKKIAEDVANFLKKGGKIKVIPPGEQTEISRITKPKNRSKESENDF